MKTNELKKLIIAETKNLLGCLSGEQLFYINNCLNILKKERTTSTIHHMAHHLVCYVSNKIKPDYRSYEDIRYFLIEMENIIEEYENN